MQNGERQMDEDFDAFLKRALFAPETVLPPEPEPSLADGLPSLRSPEGSRSKSSLREEASKKASLRDMRDMRDMREEWRSSAPRSASAERTPRERALRASMDRAEQSWRSRFDAARELSLRDEGHPEENLRRKVDGLQSGVWRLHSLMGDEACRAGSDRDGLRCELADLRAELAAERAKADDRDADRARQMQEVRACLEAYGRRADSCLVAVQQTTDALAAKVEKMSHAVSRLEREVIG